MDIRIREHFGEEASRTWSRYQSRIATPGWAIFWAACLLVPAPCATHPERGLAVAAVCITVIIVSLAYRKNIHTPPIIKDIEEWWENKSARTPDVILEFHRFTQEIKAEHYRNGIYRRRWCSQIEPDVS